MKSLLTAIGLILATAAGAARAETIWICALDSGWANLQCVADEDPTGAKGEAVTTGAVAQGTSFPLDTRRQYLVPLWTPATDAGMLRELADATMCYRTPDCRAVLANLPVALTAPATRVARR